MKKILTNILLMFNILFALALVLSYVVPFVNTGFFWWAALLGLAYPYLLIVNALFIVFWGIFHRRYLFISTIVLLAGVKIHNQNFQFSGNVVSDDTGIKVLSYNVNHFYSYLADSDKQETILDFISVQKATIICLQESKLQKTGTLNPSQLKDVFPGITKYQLAHQSAWSGPVTFSLYPIVSMGEIRFSGSNNLVIFSDIVYSGDTIRVYNCHLQSFGINSNEYSVIDTLGFRQDKLLEMKAIGSKLRAGYKRRSPQVDSLRRHIDMCKYPVIVCGDFNDTPVSYTYRQMSETLNDAFVESGVGVSNSYRGKLPSYRIDYIFYSKHFKSYNYTRHKAKYSDHFPVSALLKYQ